MTTSTPGTASTNGTSANGAARPTGSPSPSTTPGRPDGAALLRAAALGAASGVRSTAGVTAVALSSGPLDRGPAARLHRARPVVALLALGEVVVDKLPFAPPRTQPAGLAPRAAFGAAAAATAARRDSGTPAPAAVVGLLAAVAAAFLGVQWRAAAQRRLGSDLPGALAEDALAALLGRLGTRRPVPLGSVPPALVTAEEVGR
jgi:uncharacterized membrane protein